MPRLRGLGLVAAAALATAVMTGCSAGGSDADVVKATDRAGVQQVLVDAGGNTLYAAEEESEGTITCVDSCLEIWRPLTVEDGTTLSTDEGITHSLGTKRRLDGDLQVTFDGYPLYTFAEDGEAGDMSGDAVTDEFDGVSFTWHAMTMSGPAPSSSPQQTSGGGYGY